MPDLARLGFAVVTDALDRAKAKLDALVPSAKQASKEAEQLGFSFMKADSAMNKAASGGTAAGAGLKNAANGANAATSAVNGAAAASDNVAKKLDNVPAAAGRASSALSRLGAAANDNINRMQATPGNIAAQFQDIGVSAAGGMSPMLIALQQGTQLSAAMGGGLKTLGPAFAQLFSPVAILTIGIVGLLAAGLQMVDWAGLAADALNFLADVIVDLSPYIVGLSAALILLNLPTIIAGVWGLAQAFWGLAAGILATVGLPTLLVVGLVAVIAAANAFRDELTQILGFDIVAVAAKAINWLIGSFVGAYKGIVATWAYLPSALGDIAIQAVNAVLRAATAMVNRSLDVLNPLLALAKMAGIAGDIKAPQIANGFAGQAANVGNVIRDVMAVNQQINWLGKGIGFVKEQASKVSDIFRDWAGSLGGEEVGKTKKDRVGRKAKGEKTDDEKFADILVDAAKQERGLRQAREEIGVYGEALLQLKYKNELFNKALDAGITLTDKQKEALTKTANELAKIANENEHLKFMEDLKERSNAQIYEAERERASLGLSREALIMYNWEMDALAEAKRRHIDLTKEDIDVIREQGSIYAKTMEEIRKQREMIEFANETTRSFFHDLKDGLREGNSFWKSFADAVINAIDRIIDKLLDSALDELLDGLFRPKSSSGGGGLFGTIIGAIGGLFGGGGLGNSINSEAMGNIASINASRFAKGGVFANDNDIYSQPTIFRYANGGAFGLMGEAGPEAVMPLHRGSDGSLGVRVTDGSASRSESVVRVIVEAEEGDMFKPRVRAIAQDTAVEVTSAGLKEYNDQLPARVQQIANDDRMR